MKKDEDIFNIFRDDQGKLEETPSGRAWKKLEKRLDARHSRQRKIFYFQAFAAASLALILAMVTALSIFNSSNDHTTMSIVGMDNEEMTLTATTDEEIGVREYYEPMIMTHTEQKNFAENDFKFQQLANNQVAENKLDPNKRFKLNFNEQGAISPDSFQLAQTLPPKSSEAKSAVTVIDNVISQPLDGVASGSKDQKDLPVDDAEIAADQGAYNPQSALGEVNDVVTEEAEFAFQEMEPAEKPTLSEDDLESLSRKDLPEMKSKEQPDWTEDHQGGPVGHADNLEKERSAEILDARMKESMIRSDQKGISKKKTTPGKAKLKSPALADKAGSKKAREAKSEVESNPDMAGPVVPASPSNTMDIDAAKNNISYEPEGNYAQLQDIQIFEWLIGEWVDDNGASAEVWTKKNDLTIEGKGSFNVNGETIFTERMKIRKIDDTLYFIVAVDSTNTERYYRLSRYDGQKAVFENSDQNFPNQVIIQRNSDDNFSTIMQNNAPAQMNETQHGFLLNRNQITKERAFRNLKRAND